uniref:CheW domain protein n=1 Tax=Cyanothece sp. (strain PCC 7425 / ATCC 29141) TaxID=395961 RepID=B8HY13_CYAP4
MLNSVRLQRSSSPRGLKRGARGLHSVPHEASQQLIQFRLRREWFALPIQAVQKVVPLGPVYGDPQQTGVSLTLYQGQELVVIDVGLRIFNDPPSDRGPEDLEPVEGKGKIAEKQQLLLILAKASPQAVPIGLPIDSQPVLRRITANQVIPLSETYLSQGNIRCVSSLMIPPPTDTPVEQPDSPVFILDAVTLLAWTKVIH